MSGITTTVVPTIVTTVSDTRESDLVVVAPLIVTETSQGEIVTTVSAAEIQTVVAGTYASLVVVGSQVVTTVTAAQGAQGIAGNSDGATTVYVYGETISALTPVVIIAGQAYKADSATSNHRGRVCGITVTAANAGDSGTVRYLGPMTDASWNWSTAMVFVGPTGTLVGTPPSGFSQPIARVETPTTLFVNPLSLTERA
jgi:hypothetical protein